MNAVADALHLSRPIMLDDRDDRFLRKRSAFIRLWPYVGGALLVGMVALLLWLWRTQPYLIDPYTFLADLEAGVVSDAQRTLMAGLLPVAMLALAVVLLFLIAMGFSTTSNERKYLALIDRLRSGERVRRG